MIFLYLLWLYNNYKMELNKEFLNSFVKPNNEEFVYLKRIIDYSKMNIGQLYLIQFDEFDIGCGRITDCYVDCYGFHVYFMTGHAYYNSSCLKERIHQYHIQGSNYKVTRVKFYEYPLDRNLQKQIILSKILREICKKNSISNDIMLYATKFL